MARVIVDEEPYEIPEGRKYTVPGMSRKTSANRWVTKRYTFNLPNPTVKIEVTEVNGRGEQKETYLESCHIDCLLDRSLDKAEVPPTEATVVVEGTLYAVPEGRPYQIRTMAKEETSGRDHWVQREYDFHLPFPTVQIHTRRIAAEDNALELWLYTGGTIKTKLKNIGDFMALDESSPTPGKRKIYRLSAKVVGMANYKRPEAPAMKRMEYGPMKQKFSTLETGTRVRTRNVLDGSNTFGIVVELPEGELENPEMVLICMDHCDPENHVAYPDICGKGHGRLHSRQHLRSHGLKGSDIYSEIPKHIGVCVTEPFSCDGVDFPSGAFGRVTGVGNGVTIVTWLKGPKRGKAWTVSTDSVVWCRYSTRLSRIKNIWYTDRSPLKAGDILVYTADKACPIAGRQTRVITKGAILKCDGHRSSKGYLTATVVSGANPESIGLQVGVREQSVCRFEETFIPTGKSIEIVAEVLFRKKNLRGQRGKVILPTDLDGDVGVEFPDDIGAGSLDGIGREGRCLYVPAEAVSEVSE